MVAAENTVAGMGLHPFDDEGRFPWRWGALTFHTYSTQWLPGKVRFLDDDLVAKVIEVDWVRGWRPLSETSYS
jgi:hypothetical protein